MIAKIDKLNYTALIFMLVIVIFLSYGNALFNKFVWDDGYLIERNPYIRNFKFLPNLFTGDLVDSTIDAHKNSGYYRPLSMLSFMIDYHLWRLRPMGYHLVNIVIHLTNTIILLFLIVSITRNKALAFLASLVFAVYPIHVEAVTPIYNRMGIQAAFFMLLSIFLFVKSKGLTKREYAVKSLLMLFLGLLSKENVIILPIIFICYDFYTVDFKIQKLFDKKRLYFYASCVIICTMYLLIRSINITKHVAFPFFNANESMAYPALASNFGFHILTSIKIAGICIVKTIAPLQLQPVYWIDPVTKIISIEILISIIVLAALIFFAYALRKKHKHLSFFIIFFLITILPYLNIIPIAESYTFRERFLYVPSVSVCFFVAFLVNFLFVKYGKKRELKFIIASVFFVFVLLCGIKTASSNYRWRNNFSLWKAAVEEVPESQLAHLNLGQVYLSVNRTQDAFAEFQKSITLPKVLAYDSVYLAKLNIANILIEWGAYDEAHSELNDALNIAKELGINPVGVYDKMGLLSVKKDERAVAEKYFQKALKASPNFNTSRYNIGLLYYESGRYNMAQKHLEYAYDFDKEFVFAGYLLGLNYIAQNNFDAAKRILKEISRSHPSFVSAKKVLESIKNEK